METAELQDERAIRKRGGQSKFTRLVGDEICRLTAQGLSLREICRQKDMPAESTVRDWIIGDPGPGFSARYAIARERKYQRWAEEIVEISDDGSNDYMQRQLDSGAIVEVVDHENIARSRLRVDARKWLLSKLLPKQYGDRLDVTSGDQPLAQDIAPREIAKGIAMIIEELRAKQIKGSLSREASDLEVVATNGHGNGSR